MRCGRRGSERDEKSERDLSAAPGGGSTESMRRKAGSLWEQKPAPSRPPARKPRRQSSDVTELNWVSNLKELGSKFIPRASRGSKALKNILISAFSKQRIQLSHACCAQISYLQNCEVING